MKKHKILVVEDDYSFAVDLERHLEGWGHEVVGVFESEKGVIKTLRENDITLILLDINLKGTITGLDLAEKIQDDNIPVIFMTALNDEKSFNSAKFKNSIGYLVKPFDMLTLKGIIDYHRGFSSSTDSGKNDQPEPLYIRKNKELVRVLPQEILWIKSDRNYCEIIVGNRTFIMKVSLRKLLDKLPDVLFVKIHKSYAVNVTEIDGIFLSRNYVRIGDKKIPIGRKFKQELLQQISIRKNRN